MASPSPTSPSPSPSVPILECKDLCISYFTKAGEIPAVVDFNLTVMSGDSVGIVGESGCGKSTVALAVMNYMGKNGGIVSGSIKFKGKDMTAMSDEELRQLRGSEIAMIYQEPMASLNPAMLIKKQLMEVLLTHQDITVAEAYERSRAMLAKVRLPDPDRIMNAYPHQLSGGQQQRVVIAMGLLANPALLLLDEPTTALDVTVEAGIVDLIREIAEEHGTSLIFISHNLGLILETCKRISVMYSGEVVEEGNVDTVFNNMRHPYTRGLFNAIPLPGADRQSHPLVPIPGQLPLPHERPQGCNFAPRCDFFKKGLCDTADLVPMNKLKEDGHLSRCFRIDDIDWNKTAKVSTGDIAKTGSREVLQVDGLKKYYQIAAGMFGSRHRTVKANENIYLHAHESETVAIVGESGCGKSTFAKMLMGLEEATEGSIKLGDTELAYLPVRKRDYSIVSQLQMVFQNPFDTLNPSQTVGFQLMRVLSKFRIGKNSKERKERALELLDQVKLPRDFFKRRPRQLSGGQKQRVGIARAFAGNPSVVIADEPVSALDVSVQAAVTGLLTEIQQKNKTTLLFISHDLSIVRYLSDRVIVMYLGYVVEQGTTDEVFAPPYHPYTEALLSAVPIADTSVQKKHIVLSGEIPSAVNPPPGCPFQTRCQHKIGDICEQEFPESKEIGPGHFIACHLAEEQLKRMEPVIVLADNKQKDKSA